MSLWKRGNVWWAYFYIDGVRQQASTGATNRRQAELILQKLRTEANAKRHKLVQIDPDLTFGALAAKFIANAGPRPHHLERLQFLLPYFADRAVARITKSMAEDYRRQRKARKVVSDATVNRDLCVMRHILYWALDEQIIAANPFFRLKLARERRKQRAVLSIEEEDKLLVETPEHLRRMVIAALDTGMRRGEITNQLWEHIDFSRRLLSVTKSKTPEGESREIPLTDRLLGILAETRRKTGLVFQYHDQPVRIVKRSWTSALRRAGLRHIRFHDLRHTFNTRLMEAGVMQEVRMALMGHSSGNTVHSTYTHVELLVKREAVARLQQWVQTQRQPIGG